MYAIIVTQEHQEGPDDWGTDHEVLLFSDEASADDYVETHPPHNSDRIRTKYLMLHPDFPDMRADAYSEARAIIRFTAMEALGSESMGAGKEEAIMNRVLDALREDT